MTTAAIPYTVDLTIGDPYLGVFPAAWSIEGDDPVTLVDDDDTALAAPLTLSRALSGELWPADEVAPTLSFTVVAGSVAAVAGIAKGNVVRMRWISGAATGADVADRTIYFDGNVTDLSLRPTTVGDGSGGTRPAVALDVIAVGYRALLDSFQLDGSLPQQASESRVGALFTLAGFSGAPTYNPGEIETGTTIRAARTIKNGRLGPEIDRVINSWAVRPGTLGPFTIDPRGYCRYVVEPVVVGSPRTLAAWRLSARWPTVDPVLAATLALNAGVWSVTPSTSTAVADDPVIDAGKVERGSIRFVQRSASSINAVSVTYSASGTDNVVTVGNGDLPLSRVEITDTDIVDSTGNNPRRVAELYLPPADSPAWLVESLTWRLDHDTPGRVPPAPGSALVVGPLDVRHNPNNRRWFTGIVAAWTLSIGPRPVAALTLRAPHYRMRSAAAGALTWSSVPAGATWATLNPSDTWDDYRLLKP